MRLDHFPAMREDTARLLYGLVQKARPANILEIGTGAGVSGISALAGCDGFLTTIDNDGGTQNAAKQHFAECGFSGRCRFINADCTAAVANLEQNRYNFIILDGPKSLYPALYPKLMEILDADGIIFADDVAFFNKPLVAGKAGHKHRTIIKNLTTFTELVKNDVRVKAEFYGIDNGVAVITAL